MHPYKHKCCVAYVFRPAALGGETIIPSDQMITHEITVVLNFSCFLFGNFTSAEPCELIEDKERERERDLVLLFDICTI